MTFPALLIVADDLTGALDCACEAAARGIGALVLTSPAALADALNGPALPPVVAVSTNSRDGTEAAALDAMARVTGCLPRLRPGRVMKKIDSRLKGHVGAETTALARALGLGRVLAAPAIPDMGRYQQNGHLQGAGVDRPVAIGARLAGLDCLIPDIAAPSDFAPALDAAGAGALAMGARGLARALVDALWPGAAPGHRAGLRGQALFVIGSRDPVTLAQVDHLRAMRPVDWLAAPDGVLTDPGPQSAPLRLVQMTPGSGCDPAVAATRLAHAMARLITRDRVPILLATGGETAQALLSALRVDRITVQGMPLPGIAQGTIRTPDGQTLTLLTKSGGFGAPQTLAQLGGMFDTEPHTRTATP